MRNPNLPNLWSLKTYDQSVGTTYASLPKKSGGKWREREREREREFEFANFAKMKLFFLLVCEKLWLLWKSFVPFQILHDFFDVFGYWIISFLFSSIASSNKRKKEERIWEPRGEFKSNQSVKEKSMYVVCEYEWRGNKFELSENLL